MRGAMFNIGPVELLIIAFIALLVVAPFVIVFVLAKRKKRG